MRRLSPSQALWIRRVARSMPFYRTLGVTLTELGWGQADIRLRVGRELTQNAGYAHGGVAASLIDSAVGLALCTTLRSPQMITTIELKVNFTAPARPGILKAKGRIIHRGGRIAVGEGEVRDGKGALVAKGMATYMILEDFKKQ